MKPILAVLAAGMGSRYGGLKQMDRLGKAGEVLLDYAIFDALQAGFGKVVLIIRRDFEKDFHETVLNRFKNRFQCAEDVPRSIEQTPRGIEQTPRSIEQTPRGAEQTFQSAEDVLQGAEHTLRLIEQTLQSAEHPMQDAEQTRYTRQRGDAPLRMAYPSRARHRGITRLSGDVRSIK